MSTTFISGLMKGGKSEELIEMILNCEGTRLVIKPSVDTRDGAWVTSRALDDKIPALMIDERNRGAVKLVLDGAKYFHHIFVDEVQFFSRQFIRALVSECNSNGVDLVISGLAKDFKGNYFESSEWLIDHCDDFVFLVGFCDVCGVQAQRDILVVNDKKVLDGSSIVVEDDSVEYLTVCDSCDKKHFAK